MTDTSFGKLNSAYRTFVDTLHEYTRERLVELALTEMQSHILAESVFANYNREGALSSWYGVPVTVKKKTVGSEPKQFTLVLELNVIVWHTSTDYHSNSRKLSVPIMPTNQVAANWRMLPDNELICSVDYIFQKVLLPDRRFAWMTPYLPNDPVQRRLLTTSEE